MARLRRAGGMALVALTTSACELAGRTTAPGSPGRGNGGGHVVHRGQFGPASAYYVLTADLSVG